MRKYPQKGGDMLENLGFLGLGAYAASRPGGSTVSGFLGNLFTTGLYILAAIVGVFLVFVLIALMFGTRQTYKDFGVAFADDAPVPSDVKGELQPVGPTKSGDNKVLTPAGNVIVY